MPPLSSSRLEFGREGAIKGFGRLNLNALIADCQALCVCPSARPLLFLVTLESGRAGVAQTMLLVSPSLKSVCGSNLRYLNTYGSLSQFTSIISFDSKKLKFDIHRECIYLTATVSACAAQQWARHSIAATITFGLLIRRSGRRIMALLPPSFVLVQRSLSTRTATSFSPPESMPKKGRREKRTEEGREREIVSRDCLLARPSGCRIQDGQSLLSCFILTLSLS